jgi:hypothetical protein
MLPEIHFQAAIFSCRLSIKWSKIDKKKEVFVKKVFTLHQFL